MNNDLISRSAPMAQAAIGEGLKMRLIDADAISKDILSLTMNITGLWCGKGVLNEFMKEYRRSVLRIVDDAATVDDVEVVRCKDCEYWEHGDCYRLELSRPDDFCSYGDRKEKGE